MDLPQVDQPHTEVPRLYARGNWLHGRRPAAELRLRHGVRRCFQHSDTVQGWRIDATPQVGLNYRRCRIFPASPQRRSKPRSTGCEHLAPGDNRSPGRTLPILSLDGGLQFERDSGRRGQRRMTLEPRLMYLYVPYRNQSDLPVFDTAEPDLNWVELFRTNRYVGIDRISDANQIAAGITTRLFSSRTGTRFLSMTVGQAFYFSTPRVHAAGRTAAGRSQVRPDRPGGTAGLQELDRQQRRAVGRAGSRGPERARSRCATSPNPAAW